MTCQVGYTLELRVRVNETERDLLAAIEAAAPAGGPATLTARRLSRTLRVSDKTCRRAFGALARKGLLVVRAVRRDDGGLDANSYELTDVGRALLAADAERGVSPEEMQRANF